MPGRPPEYDPLFEIGSGRPANLFGANVLARCAGSTRKRIEQNSSTDQPEFHPGELLRRAGGRYLGWLLHHLQVGFEVAGQQKNSTRVH